jgi:hypothetical protein
MLAKIIKNTTGADIFVVEAGVTILANSQITLDPLVYYIWAKPEMQTELFANVNSGSIVINDGTIDLSPTTGLRYLESPERIRVQKDAIDVTQVSTVVNFTGNVAVSDGGNGKATVAIGFGASTELLREVTVQVHPFGNINIESNLLFEAEPINDTIRFLTEEIV